MAPMVPDPTLEALSIIMSGAVERGLSQLSTGPSEMPLEQLYKAYGLWCLNRGGEALECLSGLDETPLRDVAANLLAALGQPEIDVLLLHMPNSDKAADYTEVPGFRIFPVSISPDAFGITMAEVLAGLPPGARPRIALSIDAFGPYLPLNFSEAGLATVFWVSDHDYFISTRYADLAAADVIIVNGANEFSTTPYLDGYGEGTRIPFRQWFAETAYRGPDYARGLTVMDILNGTIDPGAWSSIWDYWRVREAPLEIGKIDVVVFFPPDFDVAPLTSAAPGGPPPDRG